MKQDRFGRSNVCEGIPRAMLPSALVLAKERELSGIDRRMRHRSALGPTLRSALAAHHLFDGVLDLALKLFHTLMQATLAILGAQLFHLLGRPTEQDTQ